MGEGEIMKELRSQAAHLLIREQWQQSSDAYTRFISLCQPRLSLLEDDGDEEQRSLRKSLCNAFSCRAQTFLHLHHLPEALADCDRALDLDNSHFTSLLSKAQTLLRLHHYSAASACFSTALIRSRHSSTSHTHLSDLISTSKRLQSQSTTGTYDLSHWILHGFPDKPPDLADYVGAVGIRRSENGKGLGLFALKPIEVGTVILAAAAVAVERAILPRTAEDNLQLLMWKSFVSKVAESLSRCRKTRRLFKTLSSDEEEEMGYLPDIGMFMPGAEEPGEEEEDVEDVIDTKRVLRVLDVNSVVEDSVTGTVWGRNRDLYGVGLWLLPSLVNHSCAPNSRRLHVGDHLIMHASTAIRAGEEITAAYFDVLCPLERRRELCRSWGFYCRCERCRVEEEAVWPEAGGGGGVEDVMKRARGGKERGYVRASFWGSFGEVYGGGGEVEWRRLMQAAEEMVAAVGGDERVLRVVVEGVKKWERMGFGEVERVVKMGRGVYGKVMKRRALLHLLGLGNHKIVM